MTAHDDLDPRDDAPALPEPDVLAVWSAPAPAPDLTDRVLAHVEAALPLSGGTVTPRSAAPRRRSLGPVVVGVAMVAAAALVLGIAQTWRRPAASAETSPAAVAAPPEAEATPAGGEPSIQRTAERPRSDEPPPPPAPQVASRVAAEAPLDPASAVLPAAAGKPKPSPADDEAAKTATLRIGTAKGHGWAVVFIDGVRIGPTPIMNVKVTPGRHTIRWEWDDGRSATATVELSDGEVRTVKSPPPASP